MGLFLKCFEGIRNFFRINVRPSNPLFGIASVTAYAVVDSRRPVLIMGEIFRHIEDADDHAAYVSKLANRPFEVVSVRISEVK